MDPFQNKLQKLFKDISEISSESKTGKTKHFILDNFLPVVVRYDASGGIKFVKKLSVDNDGNLSWNADNSADFIERVLQEGQEVDDDFIKARVSTLLMKLDQ